MNVEGDDERVARVVKLICQRADLRGLKVVDLACRVGRFSTALADLGADVLGVEGRLENLVQAPHTRGVRYLLNDVRQASVARYGMHDVTLCLGILYHLGLRPALRLLTAMRAFTRQFAIIDTHVDLSVAVSRRVDGVVYHGSWFHEGELGPWSSIGNRRSWWFTERSLDDAIRHDAGWDRIEHIPGPAWPGESPDRRWLVIS